MTYDRTRTARPADVTDTPVASDAIVPAVFMAPGAAPKGRSADWVVTELYSLHYRALVRLAVLLVRDLPTAEDVVQDSFVAMHEGWQRLRNADSALAYLRHAVLNRSRSVLRHRAVVDKHLPNPNPVRFIGFGVLSAPVASRAHILSDLDGLQRNRNPAWAASVGTRSQGSSAATPPASSAGSADIPSLP
jgi:Sigma-70 region 2